MSNLIEVKHVSRYFGNYCAVNDLSFNLTKGQVLGFLGVNGSGKTTTMQMLTGNLALSQGQITINGFDIQQQPRLAKRSLGYLPDTPPLYQDLNVSEFLTYCAQLHAIPKHDIPRAIDLVLQRCELKQVSKRLIANLSKGFQQRIGIAQAIIHNPAVIILDEPTVGLDPIQIREIRHLIKELGADHSIILSTHILNEVQEVCSDVLIIRKGNVLIKESLENLTQSVTKKSLLVKTNKTVEQRILLSIPGINSLDLLPNNNLKIDYDPNQDCSQKIAETIILNGWELVEMTPIKTSLEDLFIAYSENSVQ
ncbi:MAG: ATP-binding cassette domain-containing protein [Methylococcales bacterium]|nr:ATP-binding cassette domain-containing protein [Methylococcales bacterium]